ncbi:pre-miRNA 5'-monophosphate methyltransferase-like [Anneissia japonica]|uniref:pre-miRNA 5'-monophosphate methyltransferase-like n=1 Tax=Anneissia japonica TaxID=1529436 RepID=UPI001425A370|nr:pre-miRNA 5'-monophosphate methyltransferase-like [Anneissia japonica]
MAAPNNYKMAKLFQPGAAPFGNFINYYSFNPPENRLQLLTDSLFNTLTNGIHSNKISVLDIGCNAGDLTVELYKSLTQRSEVKHQSIADVVMFGCDIDSILIQRATEDNPYPDQITYRSFNIMEGATRVMHLKAFLDSHQKERFDLVCCFSLTMWIHLNNGDDGLLKFLDVVSSMTKFLLIEPHPWKCYRSAERRVTKLGCQGFEMLPHIKIRNDVDVQIKKYLTENCGMTLVKDFGATTWKRSIQLFENTSLKYILK